MNPLPRRFFFGAGLVAALLLVTPVVFTACTGSDEDPTILIDPSADSVTFWPPSVRYAKRGDTLAVLIHGLKRQYECANTLELRLAFREDTTKMQFYRVRSKFEIPADPPCGREPEGLDTVFKVQIFTLAGKKFLLEKPDSTRSDSVVFVAGSAFLETFTHPANGSEAAHGRYVFRDSSAIHPRRVIRADSLATCEILQTAVFTRTGDSLRVRVRRIAADPLPESVIPACAGPHADSLEVVPNRYNLF